MVCIEKYRLPRLETRRYRVADPCKPKRRIKKKTDPVELSGNRQRRGIWDATDCALLLIDHQQNVLEQDFGPDRRLVGLGKEDLRSMSGSLLGERLKPLLRQLFVTSESQERRRSTAGYLAC